MARATSTEKPNTWWGWVVPRIAPSLFVLVGITILLWTAGRATSTTTPPSGTEAVALALLSSILQITGGTLFGKVGRTDANHARSEVRRLMTIGGSIRQVRILLQSDTNHSFAAEQQLDLVTMQIQDSILGWNDVHKEALEELVKQTKTPEREEF